MKFFGTGSVWDPEKRAMLCRFKNGEFETDDPKLIERLKALGHKPFHRGGVIPATTVEDRATIEVATAKLLGELGVESLEDLKDRLKKAENLEAELQAQRQAGHEASAKALALEAENADLKAKIDQFDARSSGKRGK